MEFWQVVRDYCGDEWTVASFTKESYADFYMLKYPSGDYFKRKVAIMDDIIEKEMRKEVEKGFCYSFSVGLDSTEVEERKKSNNKLLGIELSVDDFEVDSFIDEDRMFVGYYGEGNYTVGNVVLYSKTKLSSIEIKQRIIKMLKEKLQLDDNWKIKIYFNGLEGWRVDGREYKMQEDPDYKYLDSLGYFFLADGYDSKGIYLLDEGYVDTFTD